MQIVAKSKIKHNGNVYIEGAEMDISDGAAKLLVASGVAIKVKVSKNGKGKAKEAPVDNSPNMDMKREELDAAALKAGVEDPESLPNKEAVLDAIDEESGG